MDYNIEAAIPHRKPFLFVDEVFELTEDAVRAGYTFRPDDELWKRIYAGHYPGSPITPGVLLCELMMQASAILVHEIAGREALPGVPVAARIQAVKFKQMIFPGDRVEIRARIAERIANVFLMKGSILRDGKTAAQAEFSVTMAPGGSAGQAE